VIAHNAVAHLPSEDDLWQAAASAADRLDRGGVLLATMPDSLWCANAQPSTVRCSMKMRRPAGSCIKSGERRYTMRLSTTRQTDAGWESNTPRAMVTGAL